jgi:ParB-like chromosome segregation protein Spo0J
MWPLDRVVVGKRERKYIGDLAGLKDSLTALGQLQPISVQPDGTLVFGERRLTAAQELGWAEIAVWVYTDDSSAAILRAELDENTERKQLTLTEAARLRHRLAELLEPDARSRMTAGVLKPSGKLPEGPAQVRDEAAKPTGYAGRTLDAVDEVLAATEDPDPEVRQEAEKQAEKLSAATRGAEPAAKAVRKARARVQRPKTTNTPGQVVQQPAMPPPAVFSLERRLTDGINKGRGLKALAGEIQDRDDLDLTSDTIRVLRRRLSEEARDRTRLHAALGSVLSKRKASS